MPERRAWPGHRLALWLFTAAFLAWVGIMAVVMRHAALPATAQGTMLAVFEPGTPQEKVFASLTRAGARPIRETAFGFIWVVTAEEPGLSGRLAQEGAIGTYRDLPLSPSIAGCFALADAKVATLWAP
jgi:hypothetical protein